MAFPDLTITTGTAAENEFSNRIGSLGSGLSIIQRVCATLANMFVASPPAATVLTSSSIKSSSATGGVGYATGAGGAVTQATSKATGVTLNTVCGAITMNNAALNAGVEVAFTLTNSAIAATDVVVACVKSGGTAASYLVGVTAVAAGSCEITVSNVSASNLSEAVVLNFVVIKAVAA